MEEKCQPHPLHWSTTRSTSAQEKWTTRQATTVIPETVTTAAAGEAVAAVTLAVKQTTGKACLRFTVLILIYLRITLEDSFFLVFFFYYHFFLLLLLLCGCGHALDSWSSNIILHERTQSSETDHGSGSRMCVCVCVCVYVLLLVVVVVDLYLWAWEQENVEGTVSSSWVSFRQR